MVKQAAKLSVDAAGQIADEIGAASRQGALHALDILSMQGTAEADVFTRGKLILIEVLKHHRNALPQQRRSGVVETLRESAVTQAV